MLMIKRLFNTVNKMNAMNKIIDEMSLEIKFLKSECIKFRNRAIAAETKVSQLELARTDAGLWRP